MSKGAALGDLVGNILGKDAVDQLGKAGIDLSNPENATDVRKVVGPELEFNLATERLGAASDAIRRRFEKKNPGGPSASANAEPPAELLDADQRKRDLEGKGGPAPGEGESVRKLAAKAAPDLPIIPLSAPLAKLLDEGKVAEFNAQRPAGRLDLTGVSFEKKQLSGIDLRHCELARSNFRGADLTNAQFQYANLDRAVFEGAILTDGKFFHAALTRANLQKVVDAKGAQFATADLSSAEMNDSNFDNSLFSDAKLVMACLDRSSFRGASMSRALLARTTLNRTNFEGTLLDEARLYQARGRDVNFKDAILVGAEAVDSEFTSSNQKVGDKKPLVTSFEGAWVQDFVHRDAIPADLLLNARKVGLPPEGLLPKSAPVDQGKILIDGLPGTDKVLFDAAMAEINQLIGLKNFKAMIPELLSHLKVSLARERLGLPAFDRKLHYVIVGPPGVGKTTCSRILAKIFRSMSLLKEGQVIETDKSGFIAGYAGQSLSKTNELIDDSLGGALIADEIYALTESKNDDYAKDALVVLVKRLWDDRYKFAAFFLGYPKPMKQFIETNPGFDRRMAGIIELPPNTSGELVDIFKMKMKKLALEHTPEMLAHVSVIMAMNKELKQELFGNAGAVENLVEDLSKRMSQRLVKQSVLNDKKALTTCVKEDLPAEKFTKVPLEKLPALSEMRWVDEAGKSYKLPELPKIGDFPSLSPESVQRIREFVAAHNIVDIETAH